MSPATSPSNDEEASPPPDGEGHHHVLPLPLGDGEGQGLRLTYYPVFLDLTGQRCAVIGDGPLAEQKAQALCEAGADVAMIAKFRPGDLEGMRLAIDTLGLPEVREEATARGILLNVVDRPAHCDFIAPAVVKRGSLQLAISTSGESPFLAAAVKARLHTEFGEEWSEFTRLVGNVRRQLRRRRISLDAQKQVYQALLDSTVPGLLREGAIAAARRHARAIVREALANAQAVSPKP